MESIPETFSAPETPKTADEYPKTLSKGERLFNWLTYGGIAGVGVFLAGVPVGYWARYGSKGFWSGFYKGTVTLLGKLGISKAVAEDAAMTNVLMQPGNAAIPIVMAAEYFKPQMVEKFNSVSGEKDAIEEVKREPRQTWGSLIKSRLLAWAAVWSSFRGSAILFPKTFERFENEFAERMVCRPLGKPTHVAGQETKAFRMGKIASLDLFATAAAASLLYVGSRFFVKKNPAPAPLPDSQSETETAPASCAPCKHFAAAVPHSAGFAHAIADEKTAAAGTGISA